MRLRRAGILTVSLSENAPLDSYYYWLFAGDTAIRGYGGNSQLLTVILESKS